MGQIIQAPILAGIIKVQHMRDTYERKNLCPSDTWGTGSGVYRDFSGEGDLGLTKIITFFSEKKITPEFFLVSVLFSMPRLQGGGGYGV